MNFPTRRVSYGVLLGLLVVVAMAVTLEIFGPRQPVPVVTGEALVGGPFTLVDPTGNQVSDSDFTGRHMLIFFGYTSCPDVCPLALQKMSMALDFLADEDIELAPLQPIFITIDPARDSPSVMGDYVAGFHPALIGLRGSEEAIAAAAKSYRVYYARASVMEEGEHAEMEHTGDMNGADNYMMSHSSVIYLMGPDGRYVAHFTDMATPQDIAERLRPILD